MAIGNEYHNSIGELVKLTLPLRKLSPELEAIRKKRLEEEANRFSHDRAGHHIPG
jgi:hypothetical protein